MTRKIVNSSNLRAIGYDPMEMVLEVEFNNGTVYQYDSVPSSVHAALMSATSHGSFHYHNIRTNYNYRKIY